MYAVLFVSVILAQESDVAGVKDGKYATDRIYVVNCFNEIVLIQGFINPWLKESEKMF